MVFLGIVCGWDREISQDCQLLLCELQAVLLPAVMMRSLEVAKRLPDRGLQKGDIHTQ